MTIHPAVQMTWQSWISAEEVAAAFAELAMNITDDQQACYVLMHLKDNVHFPLRDTAQIILQHYDQLANDTISGWILVGEREQTQPLAAMLANVLEPSIVQRVETVQQAHTIINAPDDLAATAD